MGREALGRSRGGLTTKIHLAADLRCRPIVAVASPGQRADSVMFTEVLRVIRFPTSGPGRPRARPSRILADKAYSSRATRVELRRRHIVAVIPERRDQRANRVRKGSAGGRPPSFDTAAYKDRNTTERCINKLKQYRAVATRYDKRDYIYQGTLTVASIRTWLHDLTTRSPDTTQGGSTAIRVPQRRCGIDLAIGRFRRLSHNQKHVKGAYARLRGPGKRANAHLTS